MKFLKVQQIIGLPFMANGQKKRKQRIWKKMNVDFDDIKGLELLGLKKVHTFHVSVAISLAFLLIMIITTFVLVILPLHNIILNIGFICGIIGSIYNMILLIPEKHLHWTFKIPNDYRGWQYLFLCANCIKYEPETNIITLQFNDDTDQELYRFISLLEKEKKTQD